jgi:hypothetical protein
MSKRQLWHAAVEREIEACFRRLGRGIDADDVAHAFLMRYPAGIWSRREVKNYAFRSLEKSAGRCWRCKRAIDSHDPPSRCTVCHAVIP